MMSITEATGSREATLTAVTSTKAFLRDEKHIEGEFSQADSTLAAAGCDSTLSCHWLWYYGIQGCRACDIGIINQAAGLYDS